MVIEHQGYDYAGKCVIEKVTFTPPFKPMANFEHEACFIYPIKGKGIIYGGLDKAPIESKESMLLKCGQYLSHFPVYQDNEDEVYEVVGIHITPALIKDIYGNKLPQFLSLKNNSSKLLHKLDHNEVIDEFIKGLLFYFKNPELINEELIALKIKEFILLLYNLNDAEVLNLLGSLLDESKLSFENIIEAHLYEDLNVEELASLTNNSVSTFKRKFKNIYGSSPAKYLTDQRLTKGAQLLEMSQLRVEDICFECGYSNSSTFSKAFTRKYNMSPSDYRKSS